MAGCLALLFTPRCRAICCGGKPLPAQDFSEGFSRDELAARYETPVNTIKSWLRRGLARLRDCLESVA
jgi:RNA polymerase sigma-70 factor (ECF subfamily)